MLADYFMRLVALDQLRSDVPCPNMSLWIEHEDGVVPDAFDQQAKSILARFGRLALFGACTDVSHHATSVMARRLTRRHLKTAHPIVGIVLRENRPYVLPGFRR